MNLTVPGNVRIMLRPLLAVASLLVTLVLGAPLGGCTDQDSTPQPETAAAKGEPVPGGTAVIALAADPDALNPLVFSSADAGLVYAEFHDGLTEMDDDLNYVPRIANRWQIADDRLSITFEMNRWLWSDGQPLTAYDVVHTFDLFVDPVVASPKRGLLREVNTAVALDSFTVRYTFARPQANPLARSWHHILPWHLIRDLDPAQVSSWAINSQPLSCGEFLLARWERNRSLTLVRNPEYPRRPAYLERVVFRVLPEANTRLVALETGEVDLVDGIDPDAARRLAETGRIDIVSLGGRRFYQLTWNFQNPLFTEAATRRALSMALDRELMVATLLKGYGRAGTSPIPPALWNHHTDLVADRFDPQRARELLASVGWHDSDGDGVLDRNGVAFAFEIIAKQGDPVRENGAVILRANLAEIGVKVTLRVMEQSAGLARVRAGRFDAYFGLMRANLFGDPTGTVGSGAADQFNHGHYANAEVDSLLQVATGMMEPQDGLPVWHHLQEVLAADPPAAYLMFPDNLVGVSRRLQNVQPHLLSVVNNLSSWWIAPEDRIYRTEK